MLNTSQKNKIVDVGLSLLIFVLFFEVLFKFDAVVLWLNNLVDKVGVWGWISVCVLQFLQTVFIPVPATFITMTSMQMFPDDLYILFGVTMISLITGVVVAYLIGRKWGKKAVIWCAGNEDEYEKWLTVLKSKKTNVIYLATVLLPIFPDDILCIMAGSIKMNFWWFLFCNVLGRAIGLATFMFTMKIVGNSWITILVLTILIIVLIIYKLILKRRLKNESNDNR